MRGTFLRRLVAFVLIFSQSTALLVIGFLCGNYSTFHPQIRGLPAEETLVVRADESVYDVQRDPQKAGNSNEIVLSTLGLLFSGLAKIDSQGQVTHDLAEKWSISNDYLRYTITIKATARFGNGKQVTAEDVVYTLSRAASAYSSYDARKSVRRIVGFSDVLNGKTSTLSGVRAVDARTVEIVLARPIQGFLYDLASPSLYIVDRQDIETRENWYENPNGTGPYEMVVYKYGHSALLHRKDAYYGEKAQIPNILFVYQNNHESEYRGKFFPLLYEDHAFDLVQLNYLSADPFQSPGAAFHADLYVFQPWCFSYFSLVANSGIFEDIHMRRAFNAAINRETYVSKFYNGDAVISRSVFSETMPGFKPATNYALHDPVYALSEANKRKNLGNKEIRGRENGYINAASVEYELIGQMIQRAFGGKLTILKTDPNLKTNISDFNEDFTGRRDCTRNPDPSNKVNMLLIERNASLGNQDKDINELFWAAEEEVNPILRIAQLRAVEKRIMEQVPIVLTATPNDYFLMKPYVRGFNVIPGVAVSIQDMQMRGKKIWLYSAYLRERILYMYSQLESLLAEYMQVP